MAKKLNPLKPSATLLVKLGSIIVHHQEWVSHKGHNFDKISIDSLIDDKEVSEWLNAMNELALLPLKR